MDTDCIAVGHGIPLVSQVLSAVRNSLDDPAVEIDLRQSRTSGRWLCRLRDAGRVSEWLPLSLGDLEVMRRTGVIPSLLLGDFRIAHERLDAWDSKGSA